MLGSAVTSEVVLHRSPASLRRGVEPVQGTLTLTATHVVFEPRAWLVQGGALSIALSDVARVELGSSMWVIPNQVVIVRKNGARHAFVVADRDAWAARVRAAQMRT
jgi:hypothetical protein